MNEHTEQIERGQDEVDRLKAEVEVMVELLRGFQTEIKVDQLRVWLAGSGQLERIVELLKRTDTLLKEVDL